MLEKENKILKIIVVVLLFVCGCLMVHVINDKAEPEIDLENKIVETSDEKVDDVDNVSDTEEKSNQNTEKELDIKKVKSTEGNYFKENGENSFVEDKNGTYAGWENELVDGCGWWCTVEEFIDKANASSTLKSEKHLNYMASNVSDESRKNSWVEGVDGDGIGEYIELTKQYICSETDTNGGAFGEICVVTGYANNEKLWKENNRVKTLLMYVDNEPYAYLELEDTINPQFFNVWENERFEINPSQEVKFKFEIVEVYEGTKYDDTAITYLDVDFMKGH